MMSITLVWYFASIHLLFYLSMPINLVLGLNLFVGENIKCIESEKQALLSFKQGLVDEYNVLSSWATQVNSDCCNWRGIRCSNKTEGHHVIMLDLHGSDDKYLKGEVGSSLTQLSHLNYLDLSYNHFDRILLKDIGSLIHLNYLNLSYNLFATVIPPHLGNLSKLSVLDLGSNGWLNGNFNWLSSLSSLQHLHLSSVDFLGANEWVCVLNKLPLLQSLSLCNCNLPPPILPSHSYTNFSRFLVELDLSSNYNLNSSIYHSWLINFTSLVHLNLASNNLEGLNLDDFRNMTSLVSLNLKSTEVNFRSLKPVESLCNLHSLDFSFNNVGGLLSNFLKAFHPHALNSLLYLNLEYNRLVGFLPNFTMLPSLKHLLLSGNMLNGTIPQDLGQLSNLEYLYLGSNSLEGEVSETHFLKLTNLKGLDLSNTSLNFNFKTDWVPSFQLDSISLSHLKLGPLFPQWLRTQNLSYIDFSFAEISDIIPQWFWNSLSSKLTEMDLSTNKMMGEIPNLPLKLESTPLINLASNKFVGRIPAFLFQAEILILSSNNFSDLSCLCEINNSPLSFLDLSDNQLSGQLPDCWDSMLNLDILSLSGNYFSGELSHSMSNLISLKSLFLRDNQFFGPLHFLLNLTNLEVIDAMNNNLYGTIPSWIGSKLPNLTFLNLKSNDLHGNLPLSLCNLRNIQVLDISSNNVSGSIPTCLHNFNALTQTLFYETYYWYDFFMVWKGQERHITGMVLRLQRSIDLSCNHLTGKIPNDITKLTGLISLNLSWNELTGQIPDKIGQLQSLDSLDLSRNHLSGPIPSSFSKIYRLEVLDLSYNNLSGKIPMGTQLQGFSISTYEGNPYLCGDPLKKCFQEINPERNINHGHVGNENEDEDKFFVREFLTSMSLGFFVGFWGILGSLVLNRRWRHGYFKFFKCRNN